uniref:Uncharacterized protein n=1 Tax=Candidatus Kentrum sp. FM TaxID=2126340 RepID=A0A450SF84_9GAMM|nr:MAG: hypothetical protein BECKFM1743C_GA0114222_100234 [Candidatus Kentron sp. FM]VFJ51468.1 MAG: hypothetical protein BECKFM1743A_GA0114220_100944 [Candidatus Kentron sp. FM]VFK05883.1 MAG: hypothetical protein BECKFM1743B_GA0114221_100064 [Candidatus Kentron sp. FM]
MLNLIGKALTENWGIFAPFLLYAAYLVRYFLVRKPLQTGIYNNLAADLLDPVGRESAMARIGAPNRWSIFYRGFLDWLLGFFDRWFREGW